MSRVARFGARLRYAVVLMHDNRDVQPASGSGQSPEGRLDSWKEIAAYLGRGIRTVQRWEREEGLPVHRLAHEKRGSVYARRDELAAWWESRRLTLAASPAAGTGEAPVAPRLERVTRTSAATFWPALSSDGRMLAYVSDAGQEGTAPQIWLQPIGGAALLGDDCGGRVLVDRSVSHPFWSADGRFLYYVPTGANAAIRSAVRARHFDGASGLPEGESIAVHASSEMVMPAFVSGTAPIATSDQIIFVLGDFRGDVWTMDLEPRGR
jgi:hypothetical protein